MNLFAIIITSAKFHLNLLSTHPSYALLYVNFLWFDALSQQNIFLSITRTNRILIMTAGMRLISSRMDITRDHFLVLSDAMCGLMRSMLRQGVSLVLEARMFWWTPSASTTGSPLLIKFAMYGSSSSPHPLTGVHGILACESVGKAHLLSDHF